jgi:hypothetical protein
MTAETKTKDELIAEAWDRWRKEDFTWAGLAKKPWRGWVVCGDGLVREAETGAIYGQPAPSETAPAVGREANLQDFWRTDPKTGLWRNDAEMLLAEELVFEPYEQLLSDIGRLRDGTQSELETYECRSPTYHIVHLPLIYSDGTPTRKARWPQAKIDAPAHAHARLRVAGITDSDQARFTGPDRCARFDGGVWPSFDISRFSTLPTRGEKTGATEGPESDSKLFISASFDWAVFLGDALFKNAAFHHTTKFQHAQFQSVARFSGAQFHGKADFRFTQFHFGGSFDATQFHDEADFHFSAFHSVAWFQATQFYGRVQFASSNFYKYTVFTGANFYSLAEFFKAEFHDQVQFDSAEFLKVSKFFSTQFHATANFGKTKFQDSAHFDSSKFFGDANFAEAQFQGRAQFNNTKFQKDSNFWGTQFYAKMGFTAAEFEQIAAFETISWPQAARDWHAAFNLVVFRSTLDITGSEFRSFAAFDGAILERGIQIDETSEAKAKGTFLAELEAAKKAARPGKHASEVAKKAARDVGLKQLERGCRVLKLAMEKASNKTSEQMLYRFELQARRAQRDLPILEAQFSDLYALTSDYGASMLRPLIALLVVVLCFGAVYTCMGNTPEAITVYARFESALTFSASRVFPFGAFDGVSTAWIKDFTTHNGGHATFALRLLATLESLLAIALAFLFGLAVRRRFQIS